MTLPEAAAPARAMQGRAALRGALVLALAVTLSAALLGGCASALPPPGSPPLGSNPVDPWEAFNRRMFAFNDALDEAVLKPVAIAYRDTVPDLVRRGVDNVLGNIGDAWSAANHFLQGKFHSGTEMTIRVITNTFFGIGGLFDIATEARLPRRSEDFGQTLAVWGVGPGPYLVLPFFGPRTVRDSFGLAADVQFDPSRLPHTEAGRYTVGALVLLNTRTNLLLASALLEQAALDRYSFLRDAYLQKRLNDIYDGAPPMETFDDEPEEGKPRK